jgi:hypothetical protein
VAYDEETADRVRRALSGRRGVVEKTLMGGICFMMDGIMCCSVSGRGGLLVRVGPDARELMLGEPRVEPMQMGGRTITGFVRVAAEGFRAKAALRKSVERGVDFVAAIQRDSSANRDRRAARRASRSDKENRQATIVSSQPRSRKP